MNHDELKKIREIGEKIIADLPNIKDLRQKATSLHKFAVQQFKDGNLKYSDIKWGFTPDAYELIRITELRYLKDYVRITSVCNCGGRMRIGDTYMILPDNSYHLSWCNQAKEFGTKYLEIKEKFQ